MTETTGRSFAALADRVHAEGAARPPGGMLREVAHIGTVVCETCGPQAIDDSTDWLHLCHEAMDHVRETGHSVGVETTSAAIYGPANFG
jgi:hypothetical protein